MPSALNAMPGLKFGCDPELFVMNPDGEFVSAEGLIPGTKQEPYPVEKGAVQVDGVAAEFNIDPADNYADFSTNIDTVMAQLEKMLPDGHKLVSVPSVIFSEKEWDKISDSAKMLGCSPDFNAWTNEFNPPPLDLENPTLRTASGHIHVGWTEDGDLTDVQHISAAMDLVKQLDWYLGLWSLSLDKDNLRRRLYGKAGCMRVKPYGVEYRVLSNFWLENKNRRLTMWNRLQQAIWDMRHGYMPSNGYDYNGSVIQSINEGKVDKALSYTFKYPISHI